jgi:type VI secretion system protein VasG
VVALNLKSLVAKLNPTCRAALEAAAGLCLSRTHYNVEIEHWLLKLADSPDFTALLPALGVDSARLTRDLMRSLDRFKTGNGGSPALAPSLTDLVREAWALASVEYGATELRSGHLLVALIADDNLKLRATEISPELGKLSGESLVKDFPKLVAESSEGRISAVAHGAPPASGGAKLNSKTPALDQYTINLTERAKNGQLDPVLGRDHEIRQLMDILLRRRQNNPILTGEAGVGKTAVVEGFAIRIADGDVPPALKDVAIHSLDLGLLQAGAGIKGEFENRLKQVIEEVKSSPSPIIVFIDEAHTMIGAGGQAGQGDAANLLKPALARGEFRTIAATTWAEYKKYFERDAALARRFQVVKVEEPTEETAVNMMRGLVATLENHHGIKIESDAVIDAVRLSNRYISGRQLPDKSVSLLDTTCAGVALSQSSTPSAVEDAERRIQQLEVDQRLLQRETEFGVDHADALAQLESDLLAAREELASLQAKWEQERELVEQIRKAERELEQAPAADASAADTNIADPAERATKVVAFQKLQAQLKTAQGDTPLVHARVDAAAIAATVSAWTGIPLGRMLADEVNTVLHLRDNMERSIVGQSHALDLIAKTIRVSRAQLGDPAKPIGVFMLVGPSGVGKTETAITLANLLYGGEQNMTTINMSEFKEEHKVSLLMGSPPGYVGYGEGGVLTEAVRRKPYSVILLDEMEKAHAGVQDVFYQVFDKGAMKDGEGRDINFKNTVVIMTTNAATNEVMQLAADPNNRPDPEGLADAIFPALLKTFKPAFLGRCAVIPYYPLSDDVLRGIAQLKLGKVRRRIRENYKAAFEYSPDLVDAIVARCTEADTGARNIDHILTKTMLPEMAAEFLARMADGHKIELVKVTVDDNGAFAYRFGGVEDLPTSAVSRAIEATTTPVEPIPSGQSA